MTVPVNGIAHIHLTVNRPEISLPFWEKLCHFLDMHTLLRNDEGLYCIGSRTGILIRAAPPEKRGAVFDQDTVGLHHLCFRARSATDVDEIARFVTHELEAVIIHPPEPGPQFAPGYYSFLFADPDGIRVEFNFVPGAGHLGEGGRLGPGGDGPADSYGSNGLGNSR
ncbi:MAG: VOC family protein [Gammaproteobacteria bacterium]|jgi:catechol 2,3-dioxygenase-like lactoylglutathione lyase family enzyme